jgi:putative endonuclease
MKIHIYYVYILTNASNTVLYTGITNDLERRCYEHRHKLMRGFTQKYNVDKLIYFEKFDFVDLAISREKQIKGYSRAKKISLIDQFNKEWEGLYCDGRIKMPIKT